MFTDFERKIAQKMALDIRYFCADVSIKAEHCQQAVTQLPKALTRLIQEMDIGGIVLFAENLESNAQIIHLTNDLQNAALKSKSAKPLIISIDQEGGRVVRLPHATSFSGNMAIGATYAKNRVKFATSSSEVIGKELKVLGINNNYAPVIDVNINANNPVINTRSFGEDSQQVAELGVAVVNGLQTHGIMATLKHFPGHGDTNVDSHIGLPKVEHDLNTIEKLDLAPFQWAIDHSDPAMIMTAHIQYPALDKSTLIDKHGTETMRPATMSRKILTELLRDKMGFKGIIATDALDMAGVAHYFDPVTIAVETFASGADLALMPFKIRVSEDIDKFETYIKKVSKQLQKKIAQGLLSYAEIDDSVSRINKYKAKYIQLTSTTVAEQISAAKQVVSHKQHIASQQLLADNAVTLVKNKDKMLPLTLNDIKHIHLIVANEHEHGALKRAIVKAWQSQSTEQKPLKFTAVIGEQAQTLTKSHHNKHLAMADLVIALVDMGMKSAVTIGGIDDLLNQTENSQKVRLPLETGLSVNYEQLVLLQIAEARKQGNKSILIAKGSPFIIKPYLDKADSILLIFDDHLFLKSNGEFFSPGMNTSMAIVTGAKRAQGVLPVTLQ